MSFPAAVQVTIGVLSTLAHVLMMCTIYFNETLKSPVYVYIFFVALNDILYTGGLIIHYFTQSLFVTTLHYYMIRYVFVTLLASITVTLIIFSFKLPVKPNMYPPFIISTQIGTYLVILTGVAIIYFLKFVILVQAVTIFYYIAFTILCIVYVIRRIVNRTERGDYRLQLNFVLTYIVLHGLKNIMILVHTFFFRSRGDGLFEIILVFTFLYGLVNIVSLVAFDKSFRSALLKCIKFNSSYRKTDENPDEGVPLQTIQGDG